MRHNLTNVAETQLDKVDSFYVVGSTTKEGLIEGKSNVKIDLKKAISEGGGSSDGGGGDSTPTEFYIKFKAENFGLRDGDSVPDTVDRSKGYTLDEIFDMSDEILEKFIKAQEDALSSFISNGYNMEYIANHMGCYNYHDGVPSDNPGFDAFHYVSYESGSIGSMDGSYPTIYFGFTKWDEEYTAKTSMAIEGTNLKGYSWTSPMIIFEKNDEDNKWYIAYAR